jgi:hypothetical protein
MQYRIGRHLETLDRVDGLLSSTPELATLSGSASRALLSATIADLNAHITQQDVGIRGSRGETARKARLVQSLRVQLRGVSAAARLKLRNAPELAQFTLPSRKASAETLLAAASGIAGAAAKHEEALLQGGLPADFINRLNAAADAVRTSINDRADLEGQRTKATKTLTSISSDVRHVLKVLDSVVLPLIEGEPGLLAQWNAAKRVGYKPGARRATTTTSAEPASGIDEIGVTAQTSTLTHERPVSGLSRLLRVPRRAAKRHV